MEFLLNKLPVLLVAIFLVSASAAAMAAVNSFFEKIALGVEVSGLAQAIDIFYLSGESRYNYTMGAGGSLTVDGNVITLDSASAELLAPVEGCAFSADGFVMLSRSDDKVALGGS